MIPVTAVGEDGRHAAQELGEDGPGVAPGAEEGAVGHGPHGLGGVRSGGGEDRFDGPVRGFRRQVEVGAGVPVRDRVDVDRVDLLALPSEGVEGPRAPGPDRFGVELDELLVRLKGSRQRGVLLRR